MSQEIPMDSRIQKLVDEHRQWLKDFDNRYLTIWEKQFQNDREAALTEAVVRKTLHEQNVTVEPNESLSGNCGGPDFRCSSGTTNFFVEVTCIKEAIAEHYLKPQDVGELVQECDIFGITKAVFRECKSKAPQCSKQDGPVLVAMEHGTALPLQ